MKEIKTLTSNAAVYVKMLSCFLILCLFTSCSENKLDYLHKVPKINEFKYMIPTEWNGLYKDTIRVQSWYSSDNDSSYYIARVSNIEEINEQQFWIYDFIQGNVLELNENGMINGLVLGKGKGPEEVLQPFAIDRFIDNREDTVVYLFDGGTKSIIKLDAKGNELGRIFSESISKRLMDMKVEVLNENSLIYPNYASEEFSLIEFDSVGNFKKGWVNRIVPIGKQPITYNDITFDIKMDRELFIYSYQGLPLVFVISGNKRFVLNLEPESEISLINTPLDFKDENEGLTVKKLIRNISTNDEYIMISYLSELILVPFDKQKEILSFSFIDESDNLLKFHFMEITQNSIFLIDGFRGKIYKLPKDNLIKF